MRGARSWLARVYTEKLEKCKQGRIMPMTDEKKKQKKRERRRDSEPRAVNT
jgi:hypothetical protein